MSTQFKLIAPCYFGCESTAHFELKRIGAENIQVTDGRLCFTGGPEMIAAANLNLRTVERVLLLLKTYRAETFDELFDGVYSIPWEELLPADAEFPVKGSSLSSQLSSVPACQSIVKKAVVKRLMQYHHVSTLPETGTLYRIRFSIRKNICEIMLDTTGDGLHKRGYRRNATEAPIKETLAATIADVGRVRRDSGVMDPFCGSGTMVLEAAQKANANAKLAGVAERCRFEVADVRNFAARPDAIILTNPPYGERLGSLDEAAALARILGQRMQQHPAAGVNVITADMEFETHYGKRATKRRKMYNGMIPCQLYMYYNAPCVK